MFCSIWIIHNQYPCKIVFPLNNRIRLFWKHPVKISGGLVLFLRRLGCLLSLSIRHGQHFRMNTINGVLISLPFRHRCLNTTGGLSRRISAHLILLPKGLLPVVLSDTIGLRSGRKTSSLPWWTVFASVPESAPLFPLPRSCLLRYSQLRCHSLVLFWRWLRRRSWNSGLVWVVFKLFFRFPVQLFAIKNFVQRVLAICRFNLTITHFSTKLI